MLFCSCIAPAKEFWKGRKLTGGEMARPGDRVRLQGLSREEYNSKEGVVKVSERAAAEGRLCIVLDGAGK